MSDDPYQRLAALQRAMAAPLPSPGEIAAGQAEDKAMAERIHQGRPGVPLHHAYAVLDSLRTLRRLDAAKEPGQSLAAELEQTEIAFEKRGTIITRLEGKLQAATRERDEARFDLEKWDDLRAEIHMQMHAGIAEMIQSKWDAEACDPDAAMAADAVLDYLENDFAGQLARMQQRAEKAEAQAAIRPDGSHHYVSTACACTGSKLMADGRTGHEYCAAMTGWQGAKRGGQAKCCGAPCQCPCHQEPVAPSCRWPACLSEAAQQQLADDIGKEMLGETTEPGPDPQAACGCDGGGPEELTREELQMLVDEQGQDLYRAQDLIDFIREMCDQRDAAGTPITTADVRNWLGYTGCGGVLRLPDWAVAALIAMSADMGTPLRAPVTQPERSTWLLQIQVAAPTPQDAERWSGGIADLVRAEFGDSMRLDITAGPVRP